MTQTIAEIAAGLSEAQRRWVLRGEPFDRRGFWPVYNSMHKKGLLDGYDNLSALGIQIRDFLREKEAGRG